MDGRICPEKPFCDNLRRGFIRCNEGTGPNGIIGYIISYSLSSLASQPVSAAAGKTQGFHGGSNNPLYPYGPPHHLPPSKCTLRG